jgi:flagellin-like hook-associated protein FlgL
MAGVVPFSQQANGVVYLGNEGALNSFVDLEVLYPTNATGAEVFGTFSPQVRGTVDLNPALTAGTPLADLYSGQGLALGSIRISDGTNQSIIDLSSAATIGDIADLIEANPPAGRTLTVQVTATGLTVDIDDAGGGNLTINEVTTGTTAADLQILNALGSGTTPIVGGDLDPRLRLTTQLSDLQTALPLDLASGLQIMSGGTAHVIDTSAVQTVEDLLNAINLSPGGALAQIDPATNRLLIRSRLSGADFAIGENGGTLAMQLGIRSLTVDTLLSELNYGRGVGQAAGTDFRIRRKDGVELQIDIASAVTIGDVLDLINTHPSNLDPNRVDARLALFGNGIELFDANVAGAGTLEVLHEFGSDAAWDLGLVPVGADSALAVASAGGDTLTGRDPNPLEVAGAFNALLRLHDALTNFDHNKLERAFALLDKSFDRVNFARGEIGARGRTLETIDTQLEDEDVLLKSNLADEIEADLPTVIAQLASRQAAYEASLRLTAQIFSMSLFDFL